jgi:myo-inositol 2-dehydrogenase/D-chiro-inositol 1-dehydrogenase
LQRVVGAEVVALSDVNVDRLNKVADLFHVKDRYPDYQQLLNDRSIDAVAVCVPAQFHVEVALAALQAEKHLFIEKPLALKLDESDQLIQRAKESSSKVMVGFNLRRHRLIKQACQILQKGTLGKLQMIRTVLTSYHQDVPEWRKRRRTGGGVLFEQAVHHFDLWRYLLQSEIEEVFATSRSGEWDEETATVTARMANGVLGCSVFSERTIARNELEIYGESRCMRLDFYRFDGLEHTSSLNHPGGLKHRVQSIGHTLRALPLGVLGLRYGGDFVDSYRAEWRHFIDAMRTNTLVEPTLEDGRSALQIALAVLESAGSGNPAKILPEPAKSRSA